MPLYFRAELIFGNRPELMQQRWIGFRFRHSCSILHETGDQSYKSGLTMLQVQRLGL